jgi:T5SS/PEP-CTERM-associated repeat protein
MKIEGVGSNLTTTAGRINVGEDGTALMQVLAGGTVNHNSGDEFHVGANGGANGTLLISGAGSAVTKTGGNFFIGREGTGLATVTNSGNLTVRGPEFRIGHTANGHGTLNITNGGTVLFESKDGAGSWVNGNFLMAEANNATGVINMDNGTLNVSAWGFDAGWNNPTQNATINMTNSTINVLNGSGDHGRFFIGRGGNATINQEGGAINVAQWGAIGMEAGGQGVYNLGANGGGGAASIAGDFYIGRQSKGEMTMGAGTTLGIGGVLNIAQETATASGKLTNNGGTITTGNEFNIGRNVAGANGQYTQNSGSITVPNAWVGRDSATGTWTQNGGTSLVNNELNIGRGGGAAASGTVNVNGGTMQVNGLTALGREGGNTGILNVSDGGHFIHPPSNGGDLYVGWAGGSTGAVNVTDGGKITQNWWIRAGIDPGSNASIKVEGAGSQLIKAVGVGNVDARTSIGESGTASLTISDGGKMEDRGSRFIVGRNEGGVGTMALTNGATFIHTPAVDVNDENWMMFVAGHNEDRNTAQGTLNISGGAMGASNFTANSLDIGRNGGRGTMNAFDSNINILGHFSAGRGYEDAPLLSSQGNVNFTNATVNYNSWFSVGHEGGNGTLTSTNSTITGNGDFNIGIDQNGAPTATVGTVNMVGGTINAPNVPVGRNGGTGHLNIDGGGTINAGKFTVGEGGGGVGNALLTSGTINVTGEFNLALGGGSQGTMIMNGGLLNVAPGIGQNSSTNNWLIIGRDGPGTFTQNGGTVSQTWVPDGGGGLGDRNIRIGNGGGASGVYTLNDGVLTSNTSIDVGHDAQGILNQAGGTINPTVSGESRLYIGRHGNSTGTWNISDGVANFQSITIGDAGRGSVNQTGGTINSNQWTEVGQGVSGAMPIPRWDMSGGTYNGASIGVGSRRTGIMTISDTAVVNTNEFIVGLHSDPGNWAGNGTVTQSGGTVTANAVAIGNSPTTIGSYTISGGILTTNGGGELHIGSRNPTTATFDHSGGTVNVQNIRLGGQGNTPLLTVGNSLNLGQPSPITDDVNARGGAFITSGTANVSGNLLVGSSGSLTITGDFNVGNGTPAGTSTTGNLNILGTLANIASGGSATVTGDTLVAGVGSELRVNGSLTTGSLTVESGGILTGTGTVIGETILGVGSEIRPGNSPGILTTGNITTTGGILGTGVYMEIGGLTAGTQHDQIQTTGTITLNGGTLVITLINGFVPTKNDVFWLWLNDAAESIGGAPGTFTSMPDGYEFAVPETASPDDNWVINYNVNGDGSGGANDIRLTYIPEPSSALLGLLALPVLLRRRRR